MVGRGVVAVARVWLAAFLSYVTQQPAVAVVSSQSCQQSLPSVNSELSRRQAACDRADSTATHNTRGKMETEQDQHHSYMEE